MALDSKRGKRAFTLIELLVVISIIALLLSILMPALAKVKEQGKKTVCMSNFKQLGLSLFMYSDSNKNKWPSKFNVPSSDPLSAHNGKAIKYYSTWQQWIDDPGNSNLWLSRLRPAFLDLLTPEYNSNYNSYFCPGSKQSQYFKSPDVCWKQKERNIVVGSWSYQSFPLFWSKKGQEASASRYLFQTLWSAGGAGQKGLAPLFSDLYYVSSGTKNPVRDFTWHKDGQSLIFNDGHVEFVKTDSDWFAPVTTSP